MRHRLPPLYGITDARGSRSLAPAAAASLLLDAGIMLVQVRAKSGSSRERLVAVREAVAAIRARGAVAIVNDRPDLALLAGADGVHLGEDDLPPEAARRVLGPSALVGVSTHSLESARAAMADPSVSYVALGPIFATDTKSTGRQPLGLRAIAEAGRGRTKPLVVIGGISPAHAGACLSAGADSVAMIAGLLDGDVRLNAAAALASMRREGAA